MAFKLTKEQEEVVTSFGTPLRVLAGPGTGKTSCLVEKVRFLVTKKKIPPDKLFAITFTRRAAGELRNRLQKSGVKKNQLPYANTLHGLAMRILKRYSGKTGLSPNLHTVDNVFSKILLKDTVSTLAAKGIRLPPEDVRLFNRAHMQSQAGAGAPPYISSSSKKKRILELFSGTFHEQLEFYNALDWNDILRSVIDLMESDKEAREEIHAQIKYLLVDEYQDLSPLEQKFVDKLINDHSGLCVVGDDDQSIYETFRFAAPRGIVDFEENHPGATSKFISVCHRCPPEIIEAASRLIQNNTVRKDKDLRASDKNKKGIIIPLSHRSKKREIEWLVSKIKELLNTRKFQPKDIMVLFTGGDVARDYVVALEKEKIPLDVQLKVSHIFESDQFVGFFSILKMLVNPKDNLNVRQAIDFWRDIGPETVRHLKSLVTSTKSGLWGAVNKVADNQGAFKEIKRRRAVLSFRDFIGKLQKIRTPIQIVDCMKTQFPVAVSDRGVQALIKHISGFAGAGDMVNLKEIVEDFENKIDSGELEASDAEVNKVRVMTMHSAKGCESPIVIMPALEDDIIPGNEKNIEEKRRLFYVSVTRTKYALLLSWASQRLGQEIHNVEGRKMIGKTRSRFLSEMGV